MPLPKNLTRDLLAHSQLIGDKIGWERITSMEIRKPSHAFELPRLEVVLEKGPLPTDKLGDDYSLYPTDYSGHECPGCKCRKTCTVVWKVESILFEITVRMFSAGTFTPEQIAAHTKKEKGEK